MVSAGKDTFVRADSPDAMRGLERNTVFGALVGGMTPEWVKLPARMLLRSV